MNFMARWIAQIAIFHCLFLIPLEYFMIIHEWNIDERGTSRRD